MAVSNVAPLMLSTAMSCYIICYIALHNVTHCHIMLYNVKLFFLGNMYMKLLYRQK